MLKLIVPAYFKNHSQKRSKKFRTVHNDNFHKNKHLRYRERHREIPPAVSKRSIKIIKNGRNFTKSPKKNPAEKMIKGF